MLAPWMTSARPSPTPSSRRGRRSTTSTASASGSSSTSWRLPADIFDGVIVHTHPFPGRHLFADPDQISEIHERGVVLSVDRGDLHEPSQKSEASSAVPGMVGPDVVGDPRCARPVQGGEAGSACPGRHHLAIVLPETSHRRAAALPATARCAM